MAGYRATEAQLRTLIEEKLPSFTLTNQLRVKAAGCYIFLLYKNNNLPQLALGKKLTLGSEFVFK